MPEGYRHAVRDNPFFVVDDGQGKPVASGYLDIKAGSVEAIFTLPTWEGKGCASMIMAAIIGRRNNASSGTLPSMQRQTRPVFICAWIHFNRRKALAFEHGERRLTL